MRASIASALLLLSLAPPTLALPNVPRASLFPPSLHPRTRAAHSRAMAGWRAPLPAAPSSPVLTPAAFGADPTGAADSAPAFAALTAALVARCSASGRKLSDGIMDCGGLVVDLQGGEYKLSAPFAIPQFTGNLRVIDGTLRAAPAFPPEEYVLGVGAAVCHTASGQGSCNENVGLSGLTLDGSHVAAGGLRVSATMGATLDGSSAVFGFTRNGVFIQGGHEVMVAETWVAAYFWSDPEKEKTNTTGILVAGNDHFLNGVIVFSAKVGVHLTGGAWGVASARTARAPWLCAAPRQKLTPPPPHPPLFKAAANKLVDCHTWNEATGNGGIGILNSASQNIFYGCYLDFTNLVLAVAQQVSFSGGFFLGNAQAVFAAQKPGDSVVGVSFSGNVWYDCSLPSFAVNETLGAWGHVLDFDVLGNAFCGGVAPGGLPSATLTAQGFTSGPFDFASVLLFPSAGIADATARGVGCAEARDATSVVTQLPSASLVVQVYGMSCNTTIVTAEQSRRSSWSVLPSGKGGRWRM